MYLSLHSIMCAQPEFIGSNEGVGIFIITSQRTQLQGVAGVIILRPSRAESLRLLKLPYRNGRATTEGGT